MLLKLNWIAFTALLRKETVRFMRIWSQTLLPPAITMGLYFIIFGQLIGAQIAPIQGYTYMQYIAPGLIMMSVLTNAYTNVVFSLFSVKFQRSIEEMLVAPMSPTVLLLGYVMGGVMRGVAVGLVVTLLALFFTHLQIYNVMITFAIVLLAAILFALAGFTNALFARSFDDISIIPTFVLTPLMYLGGVFYSLEQLPRFWRSLAELNPILYLINTFRQGILGVSEVSTTLAFSVTISAIIVIFMLNLQLLKRKIGTQL